MSTFSEPIRKWMSDWADQFDQSWDDDKLSAFVGKKVNLDRPADEGSGRDAKTFTFQVVGWSRDRLQDEEGNNVNKWSLLTDDGNQIALFPGTTVTVVDLSETDA